MKPIFTFLRNSFKFSKHFPAIDKFIKFLETGRPVDYQLAGCIAIDIKNNLVSATEYADIITGYIKSAKRIDLTSFQIYVETFGIRKTCFSKVCNRNKKTVFVRVLRKAVFDKFYGNSYLYKTPVIKHGIGHPVQKSKVSAFGWTGNKEIVWITPFSEFKKVIDNITNPTIKANAICDYVGFPRDNFALKTGSPHFGGKEVFVYIKYPSSFNEVLFQPNATNANWADTNVLFLSYASKDGSGRTYNTNKTKFAKEKIHDKSFFWQDNSFFGYDIGSPSYSVTDKANIVKEIMRRFNL